MIELMRVNSDHPKACRVRVQDIEGFVYSAYVLPPPLSKEDCAVLDASDAFLGEANTWIGIAALSARKDIWINAVLARRKKITNDSMSPAERVIAAAKETLKQLDALFTTPGTTFCGDDLKRAVADYDASKK